MKAANVLLVALAWHLSAAEPLSVRLDVPFFRQEKNGCGAASVAMVMHYWKPANSVPSPDAVYRRLYDPQRYGIPLADMRSYLQSQGFNAFTLRAQWSDLENHLAKRRPVVVGLRKKKEGLLHYATIVGLEHDQVWLNDPTRKNPHKVKRAAFEKDWALADRWILIAAPTNPNAAPQSSAAPQ